MNGLGHKFFACATFTGDENGYIRFAQAQNVLFDLCDGVALTYDSFVEFYVLGIMGLLDHPVDSHFQVVGVERF